ncbi:tetratricopeptide repeat protein [Deinococcus peraridilitoris]|uniref:Uncharacterized protein n=1 Tax=Deinococcus peraridilitoris (strain DSM 19664 / LMG 22246 / CIP 109416 / KR-200) TaxID=937777 RepID=L0A1N0_DEIPD|nr:tetratricopeptide repeat protein [Deinococcus peraridilitoris]AFZ67736.1 hypothetical protein Deipe_2255 [Deinococcus peraridilitoris DSM 19664]
MDQLILDFEAGRYTEVITAFNGSDDQQAARSTAILGISLLRVGRFVDAELPLTKAAMLGDQEAQVELGNVLRLLGRFDEATAHLQNVTDTLSGELQLRALRWWGVAEFQSGKAEEGLRRCERAWHGYLALGDDEITARVTQSLAWMHAKSGNYKRAQQLYTEAIRALPEQPVPYPRLTALTNLLDLLIETGDFSAAKDILTEAHRVLKFTQEARPRAVLMTSEAELYRLTGSYAQYVEVLERLRPLSEDLQDYLLLTWVTSRLAEHYSTVGLHGKAIEVLHAYGKRPSDWPPELVATSGVIARRRGQYAEAEADLDRAVRIFRERGRTPELIRCLLHLADAALHTGHESTAASALREALMEMLRLRYLVAFRPDLEELSELLHFAVLEPDLAPYMEPVLDNLANLAGAPRLPEDGLMRLQVTTLGRVVVFKDNAPVEFTLKGSPLLLAYLALHPGRTRAEIQLDLYPDKDSVTGANYIRAAIKELRDKLGQEVVSFEGPHNAPWYRLGRLVHVDLDLLHFHEALSKGEVARALALYRGDFMPDIEDSEWAEQKRDEALLALTFELRTQMARYQADGDYRRYILLANQYLRADPFDREVLEGRVEAAKVVAPSQELAKYVAELNRLHN